MRGSGGYSRTHWGGGEAPGHIASLVAAIQPAAEWAGGRAGDWLENAVNANVARVVDQLKSSEPILAELVKAGHLKVVGACYDLQSGMVSVVVP